jgi:hypothetical protein
MCKLVQKSQHEHMDQLVKLLIWNPNSMPLALVGDVTTQLLRNPVVAVKLTHVVHLKHVELYMVGLVRSWKFRGVRVSL